MDKESLRGKAAAKAFDALMLTATEARRTGRWAIGAEVLEQTASDVVTNASKPEERLQRIAIQRLDWLNRPI